MKKKKAFLAYSDSNIMQKDINLAFSSVSFQTMKTESTLNIEMSSIYMKSTTNLPRGQRPWKSTLMIF